MRTLFLLSILSSLIAVGLRNDDIVQEYFNKNTQKLSLTIPVEKTNMRKSITENFSKLGILLSEEKNINILKEIIDHEATVWRYSSIPLEKRGEYAVNTLKRSEDALNNIFNDPETQQLLDNIFQTIPERSEELAALLSKNKSIALKKFSFSHMRRIGKVLAIYSVYCMKNGKSDTAFKSIENGVVLSLIVTRGYSGAPILVDHMIGKALLDRIYKTIAQLIKIGISDSMNKQYCSLLEFANVYDPNTTIAVNGEKILLNHVFDQLYDQNSLFMTMFDLANNPQSSTQEVYNAISDDYLAELKQHPFISKRFQDQMNIQINNSNSFIKMAMPNYSRASIKSLELKTYNDILLSRLTGVTRKDRFSDSALIHKKINGNTVIYSKGVNGIDDNGSEDDVTI